MSGLRTTRIPHTDLEVSRLAYGGVQFAAWDRNPITAEEIRKGVELVDVALEQGITLFDHADIYGHGKCEEVFSAVWEAIPDARERMVLQSKCGIRRPGDDKSITHYDFSYEHITSAVEGSLKRLKVERLDVLLLHRPDALVEPDEVARAVAHLKTQGMIRYLGVSNHNIGQIALLQRSLAEPLVANQLELSLLHHGLISDGLIVNTPGTPQAQSLSGLLDYCRLHGLQIQAWSPAAKGRLGSPLGDAPRSVHDTKRLVMELAARKGCPEDAIVLAWLLHHPAEIVPIIGTSRPDRLRASCEADRVELSREEWYRLLAAACGRSVP